jgi:hypothetical protein
LVDDDGMPVPNGLYFVRADLGDRRLVAKVAVIR